jgi:uncharacterized membrane protein
MLQGFRTYITVILLVLHQVLKFIGVDIPEQNLSIAVDVVLAILAGIFRLLARPKVL